MMNGVSSAKIGPLAGRGVEAASGDYERYFDVDWQRCCHILNPRISWLARGPSGTVIAGGCPVTGTLSPTAALKGSDGIAWVATLDFCHIFMDENGRFGGTVNDQA